MKFQQEGASAKVKEMISSKLQVFQYLPSLHCKLTEANVKVLKGWRCINIQKWNSLLRNSCQNIGPGSWISFPLQKIDNVDFPAPLNQDYLALPSSTNSHFHRSQNFLNLCNIFPIDKVKRRSLDLRVKEMNLRLQRLGGALAHFPRLNTPVHSFIGQKDP